MIIENFARALIRRIKRYVKGESIYFSFYANMFVAALIGGVVAGLMILAALTKGG